MNSTLDSVGGSGIQLHSVFVYGSLLADEVVAALLKRIPNSSAAVLPGFQRFSIKGRVYPAILPVDSKQVTGRVSYVHSLSFYAVDPCGSINSARSHSRTALLFFQVLLGITDPELYILDEFEDVEYERTSVQVSLMDSPEKLQAYTYVWSDKTDPNLFGEWELEEWRKHHMNDFVQMTRRFEADMVLPESERRVATYESYYQQDGSAPSTS